MTTALAARVRALAALTLAAALASGCATTITGHPVAAAEPVAASTDSIEASLRRPGVVRFERIVAADWNSARGGFVDLKSPEAVAAGLGAGSEALQVYTYAIRHPSRGLYLIDAGVSDRLSATMSPVFRWLFRDVDFSVRETTADYLTRSGGEAPRGVFLTHLHFDHAGGLLDVPKSAEVHTGPGEAANAHWSFHVIRGTTDRFLEGFGPLREWTFRPDPDGRFDGVVDVFGDGSVWAIAAPGHTPGSTAYLVRATDGPKLIVGDAAHTRLGWAGLPQPLSASARADVKRTLRALRSLAAAHPGIAVHLGHQPLAQDLPRSSR